MLATGQRVEERTRSARDRDNQAELPTWIPSQT